MTPTIVYGSRSSMIGLPSTVESEPNRDRQNGSLSTAIRAPSARSASVSARPRIGRVPLKLAKLGSTTPERTITAAPSAARIVRSDAMYGSRASNDRAFSFQSRTSAGCGFTVTRMPVWLPSVGS